MLRIFTKALLLGAIMSLIPFGSAWAAYIDPNTGGMLFQILAVLFGLFSGLVLLFSSRVKKVFFRARRALRGQKAEIEPEIEAREETIDPE